MAKNSQARASVDGIEQRDISISKFQSAIGGAAEQREVFTGGFSNDGIASNRRDSWHYTGTTVAWPHAANGLGGSKDVIPGKFAEKVVFAKKREKTAHKFISGSAGGGYCESSGHSIWARQAL